MIDDDINLESKDNYQQQFTRISDTLFVREDELVKNGYNSFLDDN